MRETALSSIELMLATDFPPKKNDLWWRVSAAFREDGAHKFYEDVLGAKLDETDYVAYTDAIVTAGADVAPAIDEAFARYRNGYPADYPRV